MLNLIHPEVIVLPHWRHWLFVPWVSHGYLKFELSHVSQRGAIEAPMQSEPPNLHCRQDALQYQE